MGSKRLLIESSNWPPQNQVMSDKTLYWPLPGQKQHYWEKEANGLSICSLKCFHTEQANQLWCSLILTSVYSWFVVCGLQFFFVCTVPRCDCPRLSHELFRTRACLHMYAIKYSGWWQWGWKPPIYKKKKQVAPLVMFAAVQVCLCTNVANIHTQWSPLHYLLGRHS